MSLEQNPGGVDTAESEEALNLRASLIQTQGWNLDLDDGEFAEDESPAPLASEKNEDVRKKFQSLVKSAVKQESFLKGEADTVRKILERIEMTALKRTSEGFNKFNFSVGVLNCFLICWMLGAYPQHIWLLYLIESFFFIPRKFYNMIHAKPLNQALYYLDFCWFTNFFAMAVLTTIGLSGVMGLTIENDIRATTFKAALGVFCGVLMCANIVLPFVACVFHDVNTMTGLFIHLMPPIVMYTFVWYNDAIIAAWPALFNLSYLNDDINYFGGSDSVAALSTAFYFTWWVLYIAFMLGGGIDLPKKYKPDGSPANPKYDTVYHSTMRGGTCIPIGKFIRGRSKAESLTLMETNMFDRIDFAWYMFFHMVAALAGIYVSGYACFKSKVFFRLMLGACLVIAVVRGANRYTYYTTKMYARVLRKEFAEQIARAENKEGYSRMN